MSNPAILANLIQSWLIKAPNRKVLTFVDIDDQGDFVEESRTYQEIWENGQRLAKALSEQGMKGGDSFALVMANHPEFVDLMVASSILGTIFVPIDPRVKGEKLTYMLNHADCKGAVVANYALVNVNQAWQGETDKWLITLEESDTTLISTRAILSSDNVPNLSVASTDPNSPMQMLYTSGTTGDPKAILSSHAKFASAAIIGGVLGLNENDRPYTGLSLTHANAQIVTLGTILTLGLEGVISRKFTKSRLWDITRQYGCTWFNLLGGMTTAIFAESPKENDKDNPVRIILSAGMPAAIWKDFEERFDVKLFEFYGAAEGGLTFNPAGLGPVGSCGKAPEFLELIIFNDNDEECAPGQPGEICFRNADGTAPPVQYFKNSDASSKKTRDGWLRMGDIGYLDENGWLFFQYRKGGGIRRNGDFIDPAFVEKALSQHPLINDVYVYGIRGDNLAPGEKDVVAAVVVEDGFDPIETFSFCQNHLASNLVPNYLQVVEQIPKTASEKPQERFLLDAFSSNSDQVHAYV